MKRRRYKTCKFSIAAYSTYEYRVCSGEDLKYEKHAVCLWNLFMKNREKGLTKREWNYFKKQHRDYHLTGLEMKEMFN